MTVRAIVASALFVAAVPVGGQVPAAPGTPDSLWMEPAEVSVTLPATGLEGRGREPAGDGRSPDLLWDATLLVSGTTAYAFARDKHRGHILQKGSLGTVLANFRRPVRRALANSDDDSFLTNYVSHPLTWGGIALYLKHQGYSDLGALALSQAHSVYWEYVIEGSYTTPSGRDMVTNFVSAAFVVYALPHITGDLFQAPGRPADDRSPSSGPTLTLAPGLTTGLWGPTLQLTFRLR